MQITNNITSTIIPVKAVWDRKKITFSDCAPGSKQSYEFNYFGNAKIKSAKASCSCTAATADKKTIKGVWTLPSNLTNQKTLIANANVQIIVTFEDETTEVLELHAAINKSWFL